MCLQLEAAVQQFSLIYEPFGDCVVIQLSEEGVCPSTSCGFCMGLLLIFMGMKIHNIV